MSDEKDPTAGDAPEPTPPVNDPPADQPPAYQPPAYEPPAYQPPPAFEQPAYQPPTDQPPAYQPPAYQPPPAFEQPTYQPPTYGAPEPGYPPASDQGQPGYGYPQQPGYAAPPPGYAAPPPAWGPQRTPASSSQRTQAIVALVLNILAVVSCCNPFGIAGAICAGIALNRVDTDLPRAKKLVVWAWSLLAAGFVLAIVVVIGLIAFGAFTDATTSDF